MSLFELGKVVMTSGVKERMEQDPSMRSFLDGCLKRHSVGEWGCLDEEDKEMNDAALEVERTGEGEPDSLMSVYRKNNTEYWIITEWDRSITTILLPEEY